MKKLLTILTVSLLMIGIMIPTITPHTPGGEDEDFSFEVSVVTINDSEAERKAAEEAAKKAEAERLAAEKKAAEEAAKKAEAERLAAEKKAAEEAAKKAEAERLAAEKKAAEEAAKKAEAERLAAEKKAAEEAAKKAEAERLAAEKAAAEERENVSTGNHKAADTTLDEAYKASSPAQGGRQLSTLDIYDGVHSYKNYIGVDESYDTSEIEGLVFEKLNAYRQSLGLGTLNRIDTGSSEWAEIMATTGLYEHANLTGEYGFKHELGFFEEYKTGGENIAIVGMSSRATAEQVAERISQAWNNSPGHHSNRTAKSHVSYDIAVVKSKAGVFWCVERLLSPGKAYQG